MEERQDISIITLINENKTLGEIIKASRSAREDANFHKLPAAPNTSLEGLVILPYRESEDHWSIQVNFSTQD